VSPASARAELITLLQMAYSGERAAAYAYLGHRRSLRRPKRADDREMLRLVLVDEIRHRRAVRAMLRRLNAEPDTRRERKMQRIGVTIGAFCQVGGRYPGCTAPASSNAATSPDKSSLRVWPTSQAN